ncbi:Putative peptidoglycan binding domain-containing protein [Ruminococcaceae bacterium P7]|nr:Putative peptidoglycan binding domain-containing protein [Ruminococcaceae bacterium P7]
MSTEKKQTEQPSEKHDDYEEISSSRNNYSTGGYRYKGNHIAEDGQGKGKKALLISLVALIVVAAVGAVGFVMFNGIKTEPPEPTAKITEPVPTDFTFAPNSVIDGLDISGKTMEQAKKLLEQNADRFITPVSFEIDVNGKTTSLDQSDFSYNYNIDEVLQKMRSGITKTTDPTNGTETPLTVTATVTEDSIKSNVDKICEERNSEPQNAKVSVFHPYAKKRFEFAEAEDGVTVNAEDLVEQITDSFAKGNAMSKITAEVEKKKADMSASQLEDRLVKLASYETYSYNTEDGTTNMRVSLEACNGSIIEPGGTWSFNACTGDSNLESNGYRPASVISEGQLVEGIGGGICQSSSTIYNAALRANMKVVERYNHKWASSYVPTGLDATIDYPNLDLKLGNPTDCQMFIECKEVGYTLYCSIWGAKPEGYDEIRTHNELGDTGEKSYSVRTWRIYYKDGKEIDREELPKSSYDNDYGVVFSEADNDSQAVDTNVDEAGGNTSSGSGSNSAGSGDSDNNSQDAQTYYYYVEEQYDDSSEENEAFDYQE